MEAGKRSVFAEIAKDDRIMGLDREDARRNLKIVSSQEYSLTERKIAADALAGIARKNRLDSLASAADDASLQGPENS